MCCLGLYLPGLFTLPPIDRDEARFAEATRNMLASDDVTSFVVPSFANQPRINKPPLTYWIQSVLVAVLGDSAVWTELPPTTEGFADYPTGDIGLYRLASVLGAVAAVLLTWRLGLSMFPPPAAWMAGLLLGACAVVMIDVRQARADQLLLAFTTLAQLALWHIWIRRRRQHPVNWTWPFLFWLAMGLGIMTKGPITPMVSGLTLLVLGLVSRDWSWFGVLRWKRGLALVACMVIPWVAWVGAEVTWQRIGFSILKETAGRASLALEGHRGFPGYYLVLLPILFWPGSLALLPALRYGFRKAYRFHSVSGPGLRGWWTRLKSARPGRSAEFFCLAWMVPSWLAFELAGTKLPHYTLPLFPPLALLCARSLFDIQRGWKRVFESRVGRGALVGWVIVSGALTLVLPVVILFALGWPSNPSHLAFVLVGLVVTQMAQLDVLRHLWRRSAFRAQCGVLLTAGLFAWTLFEGVLPHSDSLWLTPRVYREWRRIDPEAERPLVNVQVYYDSMVFLTQGRITRIENEGLAEWCESHPDGLVLRTHEYDTKIPEALTRVRGFDYSRGRWIALTLEEAKNLISDQPSASAARVSRGSASHPQ